MVIEKQVDFLWNDPMNDSEVLACEDDETLVVGFAESKEETNGKEDPGRLWSGAQTAFGAFGGCGSPSEAGGNPGGIGRGFSREIKRNWLNYLVGAK